ncbi:MAG: YcbK family protein [Gammaproteobacteria bacterium]
MNQKASYHAFAQINRSIPGSLSESNMSQHKVLSPFGGEGDNIQSRRCFLKKMAYGSLWAMGSAEVAHAKMWDFSSYKAKALSFLNTHTGDSLKLTYFVQGRYLKDALDEINYLLRDFRTGDIHPIDPALLDQLHDLKQIFGFHKPFHIISGYRSPRTNAMLHRSSHGVSKRSLHMEGRAIDIRVEGLDSRVLRNAAVQMRRGGVGYYPRSNFVHLDTGKFRTW